MSYLAIDDNMTLQERRQQSFRGRYKRLRPDWDDSVMLLSRLFREQAGTGIAVLDAGCGRSNFVLASNRGQLSRTVGVDESLEATAGNVLHSEIVAAPLEALPFADAQFDAVVSLWVLEHVHDAAKVFAEFARVLKPGGRLFFVTPYAGSYVLRLKRLLGGRANAWVLRTFFGRDEHDTFHADYHANTPADIRSLASASGLTEVTLIKNVDPSYLGLNRPLFRLAVLLQDICEFFRSDLAVMHLVGVYRKGEGR